jgi:hypothetical protein
MKTTLLFQSALLGVATLWAAPALADDASTFIIQSPTPAVGQPPPPPPPTPVILNASSGLENRGRYYPGLTWGGVTLFGVSYITASISAAVADDACDVNSSMCVRGRDVLYIPVAGPFMAMAGAEGTGSTSLKVLLAMNGAFQAGGVAMAVTGLVLSLTKPASLPMITVSERKLLVAPYATKESAGLGAMGHF